MKGLRTCASWLSLATALAVPGALHAIDYRVPAGTTDPTPKTLTGVDTLTIDPNALLTSPTDPTIRQLGEATNVIVTNNGRIEAPLGTAFSTAGVGAPRTITINNGTNAVIVGANDALRVNSDIGMGVVTVNNLGTIVGVSGQAIDFLGLPLNGGTLTINNFVGGVIQSAQDDAIRPGFGTVNNAGTIFSDGVAGSTADAIDGQFQTATIINFDGGLISGYRNGIAAGNAVNVANSGAGTIIGRNGAGISTGGLATVVNLGGIAGAVDGIVNGSMNIQNAASGAIVGNTGSGVVNGFGGTLRNAGSIGGAVNGVVSSGSINVENVAGGTIVGSSGAGVQTGGAVTLTNGGRIAGGTIGVGANFSVNLTNIAGASILGGAAGVIANAGVTAINDGTISGGVIGISAGTSVALTNNAGAIVAANNGTGVTAVQNVTIINSGTISGGAASGTGNIDGDGVRVGGNANITNSGVIQGLGSTGVNANGTVNASEGISITGGTITNTGGALITGANNGIVVDDGAGGPGARLTVINNAGTIRGAAGAGIRLTSTFNDTIANSGAIIGVGGPAISFGSGDNRLTLTTSSNIQGAIDGGAGNDSIFLGGPVGTAGTLGPTVNFESLNIQAATWILTGSSTYTTSISVNNGGRLDNRGTLLGPTSAINGEVVGGGIFQSLSFLNNSAIRPGDNGALGAIGTITVNGDYLQGFGSAYFADVTAAGAADRIAVGGAATLQNGTVLALTRGAGSYTPGTRYIVLTANGGLTGTFGTVASDPDPLTFLRVSYSTNAVLVDVLRNPAGINVAAITPNQVAVAGGLATINVNSPIFTAVASIVSTPQLTAVLDAISGEAFASTRAGLAQNARRVTAAIATRFENATPRSGGWLQGIVASGRADGAKGAANAKQQSYGAVGGIDVFTVDRMRGGLALGYTHDKSDVAARSSGTKSDAFQAALYGGGSFGRVNFRLIAGYSWIKLNSVRNVALPTPETVRASYNGSTQFGFGEISYAVPFGKFTVSPFVAGQTSHVSTDTVTESGGISALRIAPGGEDIAAATIGVRAVGPEQGPIAVRGNLGFRRIIGTDRPRIDAQFIGAGGTNIAGGAFNVFGASLPRYAGVGDVDLIYRLGDRARIGIGYSGVIGSGGNDHAARVTFAVGL